MLLQLLVVLVELTKFIWQNVSIGNKVKVLLSISFLHSDNVKAEPIFSCDFVTLWEVIDLLVLIEAFVQVALAAGGGPQNVPFVRLGGLEICGFENRANQFVVESEHFVQQLTVLDVIALLVSVELHVVGH